MPHQTAAHDAGLEPGRATAYLVGLVEDASALPAGADLAWSLAAHRTHRAGPHGPLLGSFHVPVSRMAQLLDALDAAPTSEPLELVLVADTGLVEAGEARSILLDDLRVEMTGLRLALPADGPLGEVARLTLDTLDIALPAVVEVPRAPGWLDALDVLADDGAERAGIRVVGGRRGPDPATGELAATVVACVERSLAFSLGGDLRLGLGGTDPATGFEEHGFLNVLAATAAALEGRGESEVASLLAERDAVVVLAMLATSDPATVRRRFTSFGSRSIGDTLSDLGRWGLLDEEE